MLMQAIYQIPGELFAAHVTRLRVCVRVADCPPRLYALLFLSGLRVAVHYYRAAHGGNEFLTNYAPAHHLDDGLVFMGKLVLAQLAKLAGSRAVRADLVEICGERVPKFAAVCLSFVGLFDACTPNVRDWIARGDGEANRVRLSFAMGVQSLWQWRPVRYVHELMREPLGLDSGELVALRDFKLGTGTTLPEL
jgi:hypothetical protein